MKKYLLIIIFNLLAGGVMGQNRYQNILNRMESQSSTYGVLKQQLQARQAEVGAGSFLTDPEVEFGYYWGKPTDIGHRWDLAVTQSFEFPTVYAHKSRIRELQTASATSDFRRQRMNLLLEAQQLCADLVYYNAVVALYTRCFSNTDEIASVYQTRMASGDCNILDYTRVQMYLAETRNKLNLASSERDMLLNELRELTGDSTLHFEQSDFDPVQLPLNFDAWYASAEQNSPVLQYLRGQVDIANSRVKLSQAQGLPHFSAGYASENVTGETFRGIAIGMSLPLWNNRGQVHHAQAESSASQMALNNACQRFYRHLQGLYDKTATLVQNESTMKSTFSAYNSNTLLRKAFDAGEISLEQYLLEIDFYNDTELSLLDAQRELEHTVLELYSVQL